MIITGKDVAGEKGSVKSKQIYYFSKYDDPVASFVGSTIFYSPYLDPNSALYLPGAAQGNPGEALGGLKAVLNGTDNPHSCYNKNCLGSDQNWTVEKARQWGQLTSKANAQKDQATTDKDHESK